jgi:membrane protein DedA with SNARE-associated domain
MTVALPASAGSEAPKRLALVAVLLARGALAILAVLLVTELYEDHFVLLALLRPTKEVLLAGGFFVRRGDVGILPLVLAAIPLSAVGVWASFLLGRSYAPELEDGVELPGVVGRLLPARRIESLRAVLEGKGTKVVFLGRLAVFPSTVMAAAAGASGLSVAEFAKADTAGLLASIAEVVVLGYVLGEAREQAGPWLTVAGAAVALVVLAIIGRKLASGGTSTSSAITPLARPAA